MNPRVLIVEDKMIVAQDIKDTLESMGCIVTGIAQSGESAIESFLENKPEIVLMDIRLRGALDGIQVAKKINELGQPAIIYLTAHSDPGLVKSAFETQPENYIVKPFNEKDLEIAIGLALSKIHKENPKDHLVFRHKGILEKVSLDRILFAEANGSYTIIHNKEKSYTASFNLNHFIKKVDDRFIRIHRSYVVSLDKVESFNSDMVHIGGFEIPVSRSHKNEFLESFKSQ